MKDKLRELRSRLKSNKKVKFTNSSQYWETRYKNGGTSGAGSYNHLAQFKADFLNKFVEDHQINTVLEWGCGDGNQLRLARYPHYIGCDVSESAIKMCTDIFKDDESKQFMWVGGVVSRSLNC